MFAFPPCGGFTFKILHASSSVRPDEENVLLLEPPGFAFACALEYWLDALACL
jgi:hypothetical protein